MSEQIVNTRITADTAQAEQGIATVKRSFTDLGKDASNAAMTTKSAWSDAIGGIGSSWASMASAFAAGNIITKALDSVIEKMSQLKEAVKDAILMSARYETLGVVMKVVGANAGYTASQMAVFQAGLQKTGISAIEARQGLMLMGQAQVDMANSAKLARIAQDAAVIGNINSSEAFNRMMTGLATGQSILMHHLGLMTNFETAYLNAAHAAGKTTNDLTEVEKAQIRVNEVFRAGVGISGSYEAAMGTAGKQLNSMKRYIDDLKVQFGELFQGALIAGVTAFSNSLKYVSGHFEEIKIAAMAAASVLAGVAMYAAAPLMLTLAGAVGTVFLAVNSFAYALVTADGAAIAATFSFNALKVAMATNPLGLIIAALTIAAGLWMTYIKVQSDAIDRNAPKDNPVLVNLREEVTLLQSKIDLIRKSKGLEAVTDPQVLELKRLEMQKQFIKDQDASPWAAGRVAGTEVERANIEKLIPQVAALKKEYAGLIKEKEKPGKPDNTWQSEANSLVSSYNQLQLETHKVDQEHTELYRTLDTLDEKEKAMIQTFQDGSAQSKKHWAEQGISIASITAAYEKLQESAIIKADGKAYWDGLSKSWSEGKHEIDQVEQAIKSVFALGKKGEETPLFVFAEDVRKATLAFEQAGDAFGVTAEVYVAAIEGAVAKLTGVTQKALDSSNAALAASQVGVDMSTGQVTDPYAQQTAMMEARYHKEFDLIDERTNKLKAAMEAEANLGVPNMTKYGALQKQMLGSSTDRTLHEKQQTIDQKKLEDESFKSRLSMAGQYTSMAGQMFTALASTQDTASRQGFESAKAFSLAAAVMNTAAAIMNAFATVPYPMSIAAAALAGATGAIQIATIASTSFGGGASAPTVSAGSFGGGSAGSGGSVGGSIGVPTTSVRDSQSQADLQRIAGSMENASLAIGRVADGLIKIGDLFKSGGFLSLAIGASVTDGIVQQGGGIMSKGKGILNDSLGVGSLRNDMLAQLKFDFSDMKGMLARSIGNAILPGLGSLFSNMFGGGQSVTGQGLSLGLSGGNVSARNYTNIKTDGGWFGRDSNRTNYSGNSDMQGVIQAVINQIMSTISRSAVATGALANFGQASIAPANIATAGRKPEDIAKDLEAWLTSASNELAKTVVGLKDFAFYGENAFDALVRLSTALQSTNEGLELIGANLITSTLSGANAAYKLQDLMGGAEKFTTAVDNYFTSMFTNAEQAEAKAAQAQRQVTVAFTEMGIAAPTTREEFRNLVNSLDLTSDSGASTFAALMDVSTAFATVQDQINALREATATFTNDLIERTMRLDGSIVGADLFALRISQEKEMAKAVLDGMDTEALAIVQNREWADAIAKATGVVTDSITKIIDAAKKAVTDMIDAQINILNAMKSIQTGPLAGLSPQQQYQQAQATFAALQAKLAANPADINALRALPDAANALLNISRTYNGSGSAYQGELAMVLEALRLASGATTAAIPDVEAQLKVLQDIRTALTSGALITELGPNGTLAGLIATWNEATAAKLLSDRQAAADQTLSRMQPALDAVHNAQAAMSGVTPMYDAAQVAANGGNAATAAQIAQFAAGAQAQLTSLLAIARNSDPAYNVELDNQIAAQRANLAFYQQQESYFTAAAQLPALIATLTPLIAYYQSLLHDGVTGTLPTFALGGIAYGPSIFGEAGIEAAVPLPDGRSIPVTLSGGADNGKVVSLLERMEARLEKLEGHAATGVRVAQAVGEETISIGNRQVRHSESMANSARLVA